MSLNNDGIIMNTVYDEKMKRCLNLNLKLNLKSKNEDKTENDDKTENEENDDDNDCVNIEIKQNKYTVFRRFLLHCCFFLMTACVCYYE